MIEMHDLFRVNNGFKTPLYKQLINNVLSSINCNNLKIGDKLPSINSICSEFKLSRDTVVKAYDFLKEKGILTSVHGKGYYINNNHGDVKRNVFILFDAQHTSYKEMLLKGMQKSVGDKANLDVFSHHYNPIFFKDIIEKYRNDYEFFVVMPFHHAHVYESINKINADKILLLDIAVDFPNNKYAYIYQSHDAELKKALYEGLPRIKKYKKFILVYPEEKHHPIETKHAFITFCLENNIEYEVMHDLINAQLKKDYIYFIIEDDDLVYLIKYVRKNLLKLGRDVGCITYNDTPYKEVIEGGITTISVDFFRMGELVGNYILNPFYIEKLVPTEFILRNSLKRN
jgi:DNA-binding transcriptional regulator YhcF (GntR family)